MAEKRTIDLQGFIQYLRPQKKSQKGNPYYVFQLQTSPVKAQKVVAYDTRQYKKVESLSLSKSAVTVQNCKINLGMIQF